MTCPCSPAGHLPRFPVSFLNQLQGYDYECAYCGVGVTADDAERGIGNAEEPAEAGS